MIQASEIINQIYDEALANRHTLNRDSEKIRTRRGIEPRASRHPVENPATASHGTIVVPRVIQTSQDFITISDVSSDQHNKILELFVDGL